jgi:hypothetical protein
MLTGTKKLTKATATGRPFEMSLVMSMRLQFGCRDVPPLRRSVGQGFDLDRIFRHARPLPTRRK